MNTTPHSLDLQGALRHFATHDPVLSYVLTRALAHPVPLTIPAAKPPQDYFASLVSTIISQQISTAAAKTIQQRVSTALGELTPESILQSEALLPKLGISPQKLRYLTGMAHAWPALPIDTFPTRSDEDIISILTSLPGIGEWSAEMFLLFTLGRPDIFSYRDLGLMQSLYTLYQYRPHYTRKIHRTVSQWSPYRSIASCALWHARDTKAVLPPGLSLYLS